MTGWEGDKSVLNVQIGLSCVTRTDPWLFHGSGQNFEVGALLSSAVHSWDTNRRGWNVTTHAVILQLRVAGASFGRRNIQSGSKVPGRRGGVTVHIGGLGGGGDLAGVALRYCGQAQWPVDPSG